MNNKKHNSYAKNLKDLAKGIFLVGLLGPAILIMAATLSFCREWD